MSFFSNKDKKALDLLVVRTLRSGIFRAIAPNAIIFVFIFITSFTILQSVGDRLEDLGINMGNFSNVQDVMKKHYVSFTAIIYIFMSILMVLFAFLNRLCYCSKFCAIFLLLYGISQVLPLKIMDWVTTILFIFGIPIIIEERFNILYKKK